MTVKYNISSERYASLLRKLFERHQEPSRPYLNSPNPVREEIPERPVIHNASRIVGESYTRRRV